MGLKTPCRLSAHPVNNAEGDYSFYFIIRISLPIDSHNFGPFYLHAALFLLWLPASSDVSHKPNRYSSQRNGNNYDYSRRVFGATLDSVSSYRLRYYDSSSPITYPSY